MVRRIAIFGSREWKRKELIWAAIDKLRPPVLVVTGDAKGVDTWAREEGLARGLVVIVVVPPWEALGKPASVPRNKAIVDIADRGIAFWDGKSPGTAMTINFFERAKKPVEIIRENH